MRSVAASDAREADAAMAWRVAREIEAARGLRASEMSAALRGAARAVVRILRAVAVESPRRAWQRHRDHRLLLAMSPRMLADVGLQRDPYGISTMPLETGPFRPVAAVVPMTSRRPRFAESRALDRAA